jgi:hypothetical protein
MPRGFLEKVGSAMVLGIVLGVVVAIDQRAQERLAQLVSGAVDTGWTVWRDYLLTGGAALVEVAKYQSFDRAPLLLFGIAAGALVFFMRRT